MSMGCVVFSCKQTSRRIAGPPLGGFALIVFASFTLFILFTALFTATAARATTYIPFDAPTTSDGFSYGFLDPFQYEPITSLNHFSTFRQASTSDSPFAGSSVLLVDQFGPVLGCPFTDPVNCSATNNFFDVVWSVTFNADPIGDLTQPYDVHLILVDSDPSAIFFGIDVSVAYESALLGSSPSALAPLELQTASLNGSNFFIDFELGSMMHNETKFVGFRYRAVGAPLPLSGGDPVGILFPQIVPGAYVSAAVPEPSAAVMFGLGLTTLAILRKRV